MEGVFEVFLETTAGGPGQSAAGVKRGDLGAGARPPPKPPNHPRSYFLTSGDLVGLKEAG